MQAESKKSKTTEPMSEDKRRRKLMEDVLKRRFIIVPSFEIYGGVRGLWDLGPIGARLRAKIIELWRRQFVQEDELFEFTGTCLTHELVLKATVLSSATHA